ncbi:hypothetical protein DDB_G0279333 [Dictyostelium discoideum AX4]|uniref:Uncharacterized protein n=1 Tax=Dictyostelium discoideum TaxID=44689 RepID=Q54WX9_DICDI|nr:hypothetical protein DDB_G0279333 [Dictyostelium discoideum AX4]EAL67815.1 hypothetical protein DDB_G0279333 [Dictyostelium discoideum AX4]|eukprot:XP_641798.1 hypothetical protein DDB_G0279333 [Dictyostelium discoideum AX4]
MNNTIKSIKIFNVEDLNGKKTELVWVNGQLVESSSKSTLLKLISDKKRFSNSQSYEEILSKSKIIFKEYVKKMTDNGKIKLKNFKYENCNCQICLNEPPIIIKDKDPPKSASTWIDYIRMYDFFKINKTIF